MSVLRKLAGQTAIKGLSIAFVLTGCGIETEDGIGGTWSTPLEHGKTGIAQFNEKGGFRSWAEPRPPEGANLSRVTYFILGDSLGLIGELMDTTMYKVEWVDRDQVLLIEPNKTLSLTRMPE